MSIMGFDWVPVSISIFPTRIISAGSFVYVCVYRFAVYVCRFAVVVQGRSFFAQVILRVGTHGRCKTPVKAVR